MLALEGTLEYNMAGMVIWPLARLSLRDHHPHLLRGVIGMPTGVYQHKRRPLVERFWEKVDKQGPTDCWEWTAGKSKDGYGTICIGGDHGKMLYAPRVSWEIHNGPIPEGMHVLHTCDNPGCVNPVHLFIGSQADNMQDMKMKGRAFNGGGEKHRGELSGTSKLIEEQVLSVPKLLAAGYTQTEVAQMLGVSRRTIGFIKAGKRWRWLHDR